MNNLCLGAAVVLVLLLLLSWCLPGAPPAAPGLFGAAGPQTCAGTPYEAGGGSCLDHIQWLQTNKSLSCPAAVVQVDGERSACAAACSAAQVCAGPGPTPPSPPSDAKRASFRAVPLNFIEHNAKFDAAKRLYGLRLGWVDRAPAPAPQVTYQSLDAAGKPRGQATTVPWDRTGAVDLKTKGGSAQYSCVDVSVPFGPLTVTVGPYTYDKIIVPAFGSVEGGDMLFFGDINTHEDHTWALMGAVAVMQGAVQSQKTPSVAVFPGDIFYNDSWDQTVTQWSALDVRKAPADRGIADYLVVGVLGNHDYQGNTGNPNDGDARWVPAFFLSDGKLPFYDPSLNSFAGHYVPLEFSLQIFLVGRTCLVLADNYHTPEALEAAYDWAGVAAKVKSAGADTVLFCSHHDALQAAPPLAPPVGPAAIDAIMLALQKYFLAPGVNLRVRGNANHIHRNGSTNRPDPPWDSIWLTGGNGYSTGAASCKDAGRDCCPSLWRAQDAASTFLVTGYAPGQVCAGLGGAGEAGAALPRHTPVYQKRLDALAQAYASPATTVAVPWTLSAEDMVVNTLPDSLHDDLLLDSRGFFAPLTAENVTPIVPQGVSEQDFLQQYINHYAIQDGFARCDTLPPQFAHDGVTCYASDSRATLQAARAKLQQLDQPPSNEVPLNPT